MRRHVARAGVFFLLSFLLAAAMNVVPQVHFASAGGERRNELLSWFLLLGTVAAAGGVRAARVFRGSTQRRGLPVVLLVVTLGAFALLFGVRVAVLFIASGMLLRFVANFLVDTLDHRFHARLVAGEHARYDTLIVLARLSAMVLGPLFFALFFDSWLARMTVLVGGGTAAFWVLARDGREARRANDEATENSPSSPSSVTKQSRVDYALASAMVLVIAALFVFSTQTIYLVECYFGASGARTRGGWLLALTQLSAVAIVIGRTLWREKRGDARIASLASYVPVGIVIAAPILALRLGWRPTLAGCALMCFVFGVAFGWFSSLSREHASHFARSRAGSPWLNWYNNLPNFGALFAFALLAALNFVAPSRGQTYFDRLFVLLLMLLGAASLLAVAATVLRRREEKSREWTLDVGNS